MKSSFLLIITLLSGVAGIYGTPSDRIKNQKAMRYQQRRCVEECKKWTDDELCNQIVDYARATGQLDGLKEYLHNQINDKTTDISRQELENIYSCLHPDHMYDYLATQMRMPYHLKRVLIICGMSSLSR